MYRRNALSALGVGDPQRIPDTVYMMHLNRRRWTPVTAPNHSEQEGQEDADS